VTREREWTFMCLVASDVVCVRCRRSCGPVDSPAWNHRGPPEGAVCDSCAEGLDARVP
jgi:hypothetical protein